MKKLLLAGASLLAMGVVSASAADLPARMPEKAPVYVAPMAYNWTGFYLGLNGGYGFGRSEAVVGRALEGIEKLRNNVDTLIIVPNEKLLQAVERRTSVLDAFRQADDILRQGVQGITDLITIPGLINLDFADVRTIMRDAGSALMGVGSASGEKRALEAAKAAITSPLIEESIKGATGMLLNITGPEDLGLFEVNEAAQLVQAEADDNANIIFGSVVDQSMHDEIRVTVIATGFEGFELLARSPQRVRRRYESRPRVSAEDTDIRKLRVSDDDIDVPGFLKE